MTMMMMKNQQKQLQHTNRQILPTAQQTELLTLDQLMNVLKISHTATNFKLHL